MLIELSESIFTFSML